MGVNMSAQSVTQKSLKKVNFSQKLSKQLKNDLLKIRSRKLKKSKCELLQSIINFRVETDTGATRHVHRKPNPNGFGFGSMNP